MIFKRTKLVMDADRVVKCIVVGDAGVGKSCLTLRFVDGSFRVSHDATVGVEFGCRVVSVGNEQVKLQIWDTAGQETFRSITRAYYRGAAAALVVYDMTDRSSFLHAAAWLDDVAAYARSGVALVLAGNKADLRDRRAVTQEEAQALALRHGAQYFETCAADGSGVEAAFLLLARPAHTCEDAHGAALRARPGPEPGCCSSL